MTSTRWGSPRPRATCASSAPTVHERRLDVTDRAAVLAYADEVAREFGTVNIVINNAGIAFTGDIEDDDVRADRARHGRRLLGRRERHQGVPAAPDRLRRRARREHLQPVRPDVRARAGRLQRREVRGARVHRGAAPGDDRPKGTRCRSPACTPAASRRTSPATPARPTARDQAALAELFDKKLARTSAEVRRPDHPARRAQRTAPGCWSGLDAKALDLLVRLLGSGYQRLVALSTKKIGAATGDRETGRDRTGQRLMHLPRRAVTGASAAFYRVALHHRMPVRVARRIVDASAASMRVPRGTVVRHGTLGGRPVERTTVGATERPRAILYLHGGGYTVGSARLYRGCAAYLAASAEAVVYNLDYRLAPEHPYPAALEDAVAAFRELVDVHGYDPRGIAIAGDSAGGGLSVAAARVLTDAGLRPGALGLLSPWTDPVDEQFTMQRDRVTNVAWGRACAALYRGSADPTDPGYAPMHGQPGRPAADADPLQHGGDAVPADRTLRGEGARRGRRRGVRRARGLVAQHSRARRRIARSDRRRHRRRRIPTSPAHAARDPDVAARTS